MEKSQMVEVHDLLKLPFCGSGENLFREEDLPLPGWCAQVLAETPWVVVRRGDRKEGIPIGIRGRNRSERFAAVLRDPERIEQRVTPEEALTAYIDRGGAGGEQLLRLRSAFWKEKGLLGVGIGGSTGFETVTGRKVTRPGSDLDLLLRISRACDRTTCAALLQELSGLPMRADAVLVTDLGWISLEEYVTAPGKFMVKTAEGYCLSEELW